MAAKSNYEIEINVKGDGVVTARVKGLMEQFRNLDNAINKVNQDIVANKKELRGTVAYYDQQIKKLEALRNATASTTKEYKSQTEAIDKLKLAKAKLTDSIKQVQLPMENTLAAFRREIQILRDEQQQTAKNQTSWQNYETRIASVKTKIEALTGAQRMSVKPNQDMVSNAGLAGATLTELGRTVSDANYGFTAMANNLSQLSTLFITLVAKTEGGFKQTIKDLGKQMLGPLGVVLALQVTITLLEKFALAQKSAGDAASEARKDIEAQSVVLGVIVNKIEDVNTSEENRIKLTNLLIEEVPNLTKADFNYGKNLDLVREKIVKYTLAQANRAEMDKLTADNSEVLSKKSAIDRIRSIDEEKNAEERLLKTREFLVSQGVKLSGLTGALTKAGTRERWQLTTAQIQQRFNDLAKTIDGEANPILKRINELAEGLDNFGKPSKDGAEGDARKISTIYQDLADELAIIRADEFKARRIQAEQEERDTIAKIKEERKEEVITAQEAEKAIALAKDLRIEKEKQIEKDKAEYLLDLTEKQLREEERNSERLITAKEKTAKDALGLIDRETTRRINAEKKIALDGIKDKKLLQAEFNRIDQENIRKQIEVVEATIAAGLVGSEVGLDVIDKLQSRLLSLGLSAADTPDREQNPQKRLERTLRQVQEGFNFITNLAQASLDAEMSIEEARTAKLNNSLRLRLRNEKLTAEQREAINNQIARNEESLQQKRDKIAEKQFKLQKAIAIGQALITTYEMATRAYNAVLAGPEKFLGISALALAKVAAATATLFGLAQVRAISRQQFVPSAISSGSGGGGEASAPTVQAPSFNVVGQSNVSQLAAVVQGQLDRPVKTYVVASDVSTAQELERKKISTATI